MRDTNFFPKANKGLEMPRLICRVENCDSTAREAFYCTAHSRRIKKYGDPDVDKRIKSYDGETVKFLSIEEI
jgi:hypothetical protein